MHNSQHAFQQGKSTESALHELTSQIEENFRQKEFLAATFMDIAGAFDNITFETINTHMGECGLDTQVTNWINFMLTHRNIQLTSHGRTVTVQATRGTPQGGVLSPTLWILVMDSLLKKLQADGFKAIGYADDLAVICRGKHLATISERTQRAVTIVEKWCVNAGLSVNPDKSELVIFTKNRKLIGFKNPKIFGKEIVRANSVKYLGITLDSKLNWSEHIENRLNKCIRIFWSCRSAIGKSWGLSPKSILWIYTAIVRPILTYGAFIWWTGTKTATIRKKMNHLQRMVCLACTGAMSTTPQAAMEVLLKLPKLETYIETEARNTAFRLRNLITDNQIRTAAHTHALSDLYSLNGIFNARADKIQKVYIFDKKFEIILPKREEWQSGHMTVDYHSHVYFTDGSVKLQGSGYGVYYANENTVLMDQCGLYAKPKQSELIAIQACCIDAKQRNIQGNIAIYSDSTVALNALANCCIDSALVLECIEMLQQLAVNRSIKLIWLPGHSGIYGNEVADKLADRASSRPTVGPEPITAIDYKMVRAANDEWLDNQIAQMWHSVQGCAHAKCFINSADISLTKQINNMPKQDIRIVTGLITGHCKLNQHLVRLRLRDDPDCDLCGTAIETAKHIICDCKEIGPIRQNLYGAHTIKPEDLCKFPLQKLVTFYKKCSESNSHLSRIF